MELHQSSTLPGRVREVIRYKHHSIRTERFYVEWARRFVRFHGRRHPRDMGVTSQEFLGTSPAAAGCDQSARCLKFNRLVLDLVP